MSRKLAFRGGGGERAAPLLADFGPSATIFRVPSDGRVRTHPYLRLVAYYALLGLAVWLVVSRFPTVPQLLERFREISVLGAAGGKGALFQEAAAAAKLSEGEWALVTLLSMLTALLLVLPVAGVYMITKQRSGYDQSVVQTVIILPMTVAGTVILVQNSLALAFALAAIVAAVRFRNTLKDTKDAVYIFLALAVGVAAGVFAPTVAAVMSLTFNAVVLALWKSNVGNIYADQLARTTSLPPAEQLLAPRDCRPTSWPERVTRRGNASPACCSFTPPNRRTRSASWRSSSPRRRTGGGWRRSCRPGAGARPSSTCFASRRDSWRRRCSTP